jgi:hypothetical protein
MGTTRRNVPPRPRLPQVVIIMVPFVFAMLIGMHRKFMFTDVHIDNFDEVQAHYFIKSMNE